MQGQQAFVIQRVSIYGNKLQLPEAMQNHSVLLSISLQNCLGDPDSLFVKYQDASPALAFELNPVCNYVAIFMKTRSFILGFTASSP